jgi:ATP-dependent 26S proteasome regulatory subunit
MAGRAAGRAQVAGVSFGDVGGLDHYIRALKEMVFLPLARPMFCRTLTHL